MPRTITRAELSESIHKNVGLSRNDSSDLLEMVLNEISTSLTNGESVKIVIGYSSINTNRVTIPAESESYVDIENVSFNANLFSDVLTANGECESATLEISSQGLGRINFKVDDYDVTYWLVATTTVD